MYNYTRQEAADILWVSTRSIDRYIKSGKLRSKKQGKIIYIHAVDVENTAGKNTGTQAEIIVESTYATSPNTSQEVATNTQHSQAALEKIYIDLRNEIQKKDQAIQDLSLQLGQAQEIAKNSVSLVDFKKSQFLLEESKGHLAQEVSQLKEHKTGLEKQLKYEKSTNYLLIAFCVVLLIGLGLVWFVKI